ncbi:MAG: zinc-ribbon domain-containing protein [Actinomycetota bacterium]
MKRCAACGEENSDRAKFCQACAAPLPEHEELAAEVRKVVTIVFADVTGSTRLGERLDPEALRRVMGRYFDAMAESDRPARWDGREVHRRRGHGGLRDFAAARGRCTVGNARASICLRTPASSP